MSVLNNVRPKRVVGTCRFCGLNIWNKRRMKKSGCCTKNCRLSYEILIGSRSHPLREELVRKFNKYGGSMYTTIKWLKLRQMVFTKDGRVCAKCGSNREPLHIDHITPVSWCEGYYWQIRNLQVLCQSCNLGKSNLDETDWRPHKRGLS